MSQITLSNVFKARKHPNKVDFPRKASRSWPRNSETSIALSTSEIKISGRHTIAAGGDLGYYFPAELFSMMATNLLLADLFSLVLTDKLVATRTLPFILKHVASPYVFHMKREDLRILRLWACIDSNAFGKFVGNMDLIYLDITNMEWTTGQVQAAIATFIQVIARRPEFVCEQIVLYIDGPRHYKESLEIMECISTKPSIKSLSIQFISDLDGWDLGPTSITPLKYERLPLQYLKHFEVRAPIWSNWTPGSFREFLNMFQCGNIESFTVAGRMGKDWPQGFFERHPQISDIFIDPGELFYFAADYSDLTKHVTIPSPYSLIPLSIPENPRVCLMNCGTISVLRGTTLNILPYLQHLKNSHIAANKITTLVIHDVPDVDTTDFVQSVVQCVNLCPNLSALKIGYRILRQFSVQEFYNDKQDFTVTLCNKDLQNDDQIAAYTSCWADLFKNLQVMSEYSPYRVLRCLE